MEKIREFFNTIAADPRAKEILSAAEKPETYEEELQLYAETAAKLDYDVSADDLRFFFEENERQCREKTEQTAAKIREIPDEQLGSVAGGRGGDSCSDTYQDRENCWFEDGCDRVINSYPGYICRSHYWDTHCQAPSHDCPNIQRIG